MSASWQREVDIIKRWVINEDDDFYNQYEALRRRQMQNHSFSDALMKSFLVSGIERSLEFLFKTSQEAIENNLDELGEFLSARIFDRNTPKKMMSLGLLSKVSQMKREREGKSGTAQTEELE